MFKVNNKDTRRMTSFWCLYSKLQTNFISCFSVRIVNFEQINTGWGGVFRTLSNINDEAFYENSKHDYYSSANHGY